MNRNDVGGHQGDAINAIPAAADYNFRRLLVWLELLLFAVLFAWRQRRHHNVRLPPSDLCSSRATIANAAPQ
jgi:hypothetical protein